MNYLNTRPLLLGLEKPPFKDEIELTGNYPALVAKKLREGEIEVGLIPVAALKTLAQYFIVGSHCISTEKESASVALFSQVPLEKIERVYLDYQSRTSAALVQVLFKKYWKKDVIFELATSESYIDSIGGTTAGLIIGDRALRSRAKFEFIYDLGEAWIHLTGKPFVFAVWASTQKLNDQFVKKFDQANGLGLVHLDEVLSTVPYQVGYDLRHYYTSNMNYQLTEEKRESINLFLTELSQLPIVSP